MKCYRYSDPNSVKVKTSFGPHIQQASNTLTRCESVCDEMPDAGSGMGNSLKVIQVNLSRLLRSDPPFHATPPWLFCGCLIPRSTCQRVAPVARFAL